MLTGALRILVNKINIEIMHWKLVKSEMFNFMTSLTNVLMTLVDVG